MFRLILVPLKWTHKSALFALCKQGAIGVFYLMWDLHTARKLKKMSIAMVNQWQAAHDTVDGLM
jgi:hypothetical protein